MTTDVEIANTALARIGDLPIASFDVQTPSVQNIKRIYDGVLVAVLSAGRWKCCKITRPLSHLADVPVRYYKYAHALPPDRIALPYGYNEDKNGRRPLTKFALSDNQVWSDAPDIWALYEFRAGPAFWPGYLAEVIVLALMAEFAGAVREDWTLRNNLRRDCYGPPEYQGESGKMGEAMAIDAQTSPAAEIDGGHNPLISARYLPGDARNGWD